MPGLTSGRPRKPTLLKVLSGTARKDRINAKAPSSKPEKLPPAPKDLGDGEKRAWRTLAALVDPLNISTRADVVAFRQMAISLAMIDQAREDLRAAGGLVYEVIGDAGVSYRKRPEVEIILQFKKQLSTELSRFGLSPADRERVTAIGDDGAGDPLDEFAVGGDRGA